MKRKILVWLKKPFLLVFWFFKRMACRLPLAGKKLMKRRKKIYETHINDLIKFKDKSPLDMVSAPPWSRWIYGGGGVLGKYLSSTI